MFQHPEDLRARPTHVWHGVAIGWSKDIGASIIHLENACERISGAKISLQDKSLLLLSFFAPTSGKDDDFLESISNLEDYLQCISAPGDQIIMGADSVCLWKTL